MVKFNLRDTLFRREALNRSGTPKAGRRSAAGHAQLIRQLCMGYDAFGLRWKATRTRQGGVHRMKDGAARNAPRFHRRFARRSARLGGKPRNRESGEDPTCGAATAAASPASPPIPRQRNETPAGAPGLSTCSPTPSATARLRCHAATCSSARTLSRSHHRTSASALHGQGSGPSHSGRPSCCASMGEVTKKARLTSAAREQASRAAPTAPVAGARVAFNSRTKQWT